MSGEAATAARRRDIRVPSEDWIGRVWSTTAMPERDVAAGKWAVVTKCGDTAEGEADDARLRGLRTVLYSHIQ